MLQRRFITICAFLFCAAACQKRVAVTTSETPSAPSPTVQEQAAPAPEPTINPALQREADRLKFSEALQKDLNQALRLAAEDSVSAHLSFKELAERKKDGPNPAQKSWLEKQAATFRPEAIATLQRDYDAAAQRLDLRELSMAFVVANRIEANALNDKALSLKEAKNKLLSGTLPPEPVWRVKSVRGELLKEAYEEGSRGGTGSGLTLTPKEGMRILRVTAHVENLSPQRDKAYALWGLGEMKRVFSGFSELSKKPAAVAFQWLDEEWIWLAASSDEMFPCAHVCEGSAMRGMNMTISRPDGSAKLVAMPEAVKQGEEAKIDVLFSVPAGKRHYQLLIFGAAPVRVE